MIKRIVKLYIRIDQVENFIELFNQNKKTIRSFDGCFHAECLQSVDDPCVFFTYSHWQSVDHLNKYRHSEIFRKIWKQTKALFGDKPIAWSTKEVSTEL